MEWAYGVTTVPSRFDDTLPGTLRSLAKAGFDFPHVFIDGEGAIPTYLAPFEITQHAPPLKTFGNWITALWELWLRNKRAEMFAIFQDDLLACKNLRGYLERVALPSESYLNLYTAPLNETDEGWYEAPQNGRGAVGLVFPLDGVRTILSSCFPVDHVRSKRGESAIDAAVFYAMSNAGWKELVHNPSLLQHTGTVKSAAGNTATIGSKVYATAPTFPGEDFDALKLL